MLTMTSLQKSMWWFKDTDDMGLAQQGQPNPLPLPPAQATTYPLSGSGPILGFANRFVRGHGSICCLACCLEASMLRCRTSLPLETDCKHVVKVWPTLTWRHLHQPSRAVLHHSKIPQFQSPLGRLSVFSWPWWRQDTSTGARGFRYVFLLLCFVFEHSVFN